MVVYARGFFFLSFFFPSYAAVPEYLPGAPRPAVASVVLHARARTILARVNYELRKIVSEDDLDTQRAARKGIDVRHASLDSFMSPRRGKRVGRLKEKRRKKEKQ